MTVRRCQLCRHAELAADETRLCLECQTRFGVPDRLGPSRRLPRPCSRCDHAEIIRAVVRERGAGDWYSRRVAPLGVTFRRVVVTSVAREDRSLDEPDLREPAGAFEVYVCRGCGFTEWYALEPENVPIGPEYGTELIDVRGRGPWR
jgi:hypothetical protein